MKKFETIDCYYCGQKAKKENLVKQKAKCKRCGSTIYESYSSKDFQFSLLYAVTSLVLFFPSQIYPIFTFELNNVYFSTTFFGSAITLFNEGYLFLALIVLLTATIFPFILLICIIIITMNKLEKLNIKNEKELYKIYEIVKTYSFIEVFLIALVVAYIKLIDISSVEVHNSIYYFIGCVLFYTLSKVHLQLTRIHVLDQDFPNSFNMTFALIVSGVFLYIPSNILPMMNISKFGNIEPDTIMSGIMDLMTHDMQLIGIIVFFASIVIPLFKLIGMLFILLSIKFRFNIQKVLLLRLYKFIEVIGKYSILDVYMMALLVALVREESIAFVEPGEASTYFALVIFLTIFATQTFDTKLIWKENGRSRNKK